MRVFKYLPVISLSIAMVACGDLTQEELNSISNSIRDNNLDDINNVVDSVDQASSNSSSMTISWNPVFIDNGSSSTEASSYRVLYSQTGERPEQAMSDSTQVSLSGISSLANYDVLIEGYDSEGNSLFISDYTVM